MNPAIALRKTPDGRIQARRLDGRPLTPKDKEQARLMAGAENAGRPFTPLNPEQAAEIDSGNVEAVLIDSEVLGAPLWLAFNESFDPGDGVPVFYPHDLSFLKRKSPETLRKVYETKRAFGPGTRVRQ